MSDAKKISYKTPRKAAILNYIKKNKEAFLKPEDIKEALARGGTRLSLVTVYRYLERLEEENQVVRVADVDGKRSLYRYVALDEKDFSHGKMICLRCGKLMPLECTLLETFYEHVQKEHGCKLDYQKTVLYCICPDCLRQERKKAK